MQGWALQYRQVTVLESSESGARTSDCATPPSRAATAGVPVRTQSDLNGQTGAPVDGNAERDDRGLEVSLRGAKRNAVTVPPARCCFRPPTCGG